MKTTGVYFGHDPWNALESLKTLDDAYISIASFEKHIPVVGQQVNKFKLAAKKYKVKKNGRFFITIDQLCDVIESCSLFANKNERSLVYEDLMSIKKQEKKNSCCLDNRFIRWLLWGTK